MTREEALKKVAEAYELDTLACKGFVKALEAVGLLKLEEAPKSTLMNVAFDMPEGAKVYQVILKTKEDYTIVANIKNCFPPEVPTPRQMYSCGITADNLKALEEKGYKIVKL